MGECGKQRSTRKGLGASIIKIVLREVKSHKAAKL
jgi:hypothetical protein